VPDLLVERAERQLTLLDNIVKRALKWPKRMIVILVVTCVLLAGGLGAISYLYASQSALTAQVQAQADSARHEAAVIQNAVIAGCEYNNRRDAADIGNWNFFINLALTGNKNPAAPAAAALLRTHIANADAPRDCQKEYGK
jgi:hypothetical protein